MGTQLNPDMTAFPQIQENNTEVCLIECKLLNLMSRLPRLPLFPRLTNLSDWNKINRKMIHPTKMQRQTFLEIGVNSYFKRYPTAAGYQCHCHAELLIDQI